MIASEGSGGDDVLRSAVFVDFDNVYIGLRNLDPHAAEAFASDPSPWLSWIEGGMPGREDPRLSDLGERRGVVPPRFPNPGGLSGLPPLFTRPGLSAGGCPP